MNGLCGCLQYTVQYCTASTSVQYCTASTAWQTADPVEALRKELSQREKARRTGGQRPEDLLHHSARTGHQGEDEDSCITRTHHSARTGHQGEDEDIEC